jgi:uncharacterized protein
MTEDPHNYGPPKEPAGGVTAAGMSPQDERMWSMLAHLTIFINLLTGFFGPLAALVIWLVYKDRSRMVGFHALQSLWYQIAWLVILTAGWVLTALLLIVIVGFLLIPVMILLSFVPFIHSAYAAYKVYQGEDYRYPIIADMLSG